MDPGCRYLVIDGHSLLIGLAQIRVRHHAQPRKARASLVRFLEQVQDYSGLRVSVVFDGRKGSKEPPLPDSIQIRYAEEHQTADALIERAVACYERPAEITVVTGDGGERTTIESFGAHCSSPEHFLSWAGDLCPRHVYERFINGD